MYKKRFNELTIKDDFMFGEIMYDPEICRRALEIILDKKISYVHVRKEQDIAYHSEYKGIRLDIQAVDENQNVYSVEMQVLNKDDLKKRSRYYHGQIDMELLHKGKMYSELPTSYVIFICDFDLFGENLFRYTFSGTCEECSDLAMNDGNVTVYLNTKGKNESEVSRELISFLRFVHTDIPESEQDFDDEFVGVLQQKIREIKSNREMEMKYMKLALEIMKVRLEGKAEGKIEAIIDALSDLGTISDNLNLTIHRETNLDVLKRWLKLAFRVDSVEQFVQNMY